MNEAEKIAPKTVRKLAAPKTAAGDVFGMSNVEMPEAFREAAEATAKQAREAYDKFRSAAEEATDMLEDQFESTRTGFVALNAKAIDAAKANTDATFKFAKDVLAVKSVAEAIELQTAYARQQYDLFSAQAKEMQELVQKLATEQTAPVKDAFGKFMKDMKAA